MNTKQRISRSKFLSLVLRHDPGAIGLELDANGWARVDGLLGRLAAHGAALTREELEEIVATNEKQRFELDPALGRIRARQGHSVEVDLELPPVEPPEFLFHGTAGGSVASILREGLRPQARQHVHLSADAATARAVGARHGKPVVFEVASGGMHRSGLVFHRATNGVWLTDRVPREFLAVCEAPAS